MVANTEALKLDGFTSQAKDWVGSAADYVGKAANNTDWYDLGNTAGNTAYSVGNFAAALPLLNGAAISYFVVSPLTGKIADGLGLTGAPRFIFNFVAPMAVTAGLTVLATAAVGPLASTFVWGNLPGDIFNAFANAGTPDTSGYITTTYHTPAELPHLSYTDNPILDLVAGGESGGKFVFHGGREFDPSLPLWQVRAENLAAGPVQIMPRNDVWNGIDAKMPFYQAHDIAAERLIFDTRQVCKGTIEEAGLRVREEFCALQGPDGLASATCRKYGNVARVPWNQVTSAISETRQLFCSL